GEERDRGGREGATTVRARKLAVLLLGVGLAAGVLLVPLPGSWRGIWQARLLNLAHVPLFAALTWFLWRLLGPGLTRPVLIAVALAGLTELAQDWTGRSGGFADFLFGAAGAFAAAAGIRVRRARGLPARAGYLLLAAGLLAWPLAETAPYLVDAYEGSRAFPTLADFHTRRELLRWRCRQAELRRVPAPGRPGAWSGRLDFFPGPHPYPYGALRPIVRDFRAHRWLCCSFAVEEGPLDLVISLRSGPGEWGETCHYQRQQRFGPGEHLVRFDLPAVAPKADPRPLDLSDVWIIQFFLVRPQDPRTVYLHRVWLEE
ncbi:MAG TPA: hypothetical protein VIL46_14170, partial [Gemmataceae bacterium]